MGKMALGLLCAVMAALASPAAAATASAGETVRESDKGRAVSMIIFVESPIKSSADYRHLYWSSGLESLNPAKHLIELEVRSADNKIVVARVPKIVHYLIDAGNVTKFSGTGDDTLSDAQKLWMGELADGDYLAAVIVDGRRASNVAPFTVDSKADSKNAPTLALTPLPLAPGQKTPCLGLTVTGPDPADTTLDYMHICYPTLIIDGADHGAGQPGGWAGANEVIKPGQRYLRLLPDLERYKIDDPSGFHHVKARIGEHESAEVTIPAGNDSCRLWDATTATVEKLSYEQAQESASKPMIVRGTVTDGAGKPTEGVTIRVVTSGDAEPPVETGSAKSGPDGKYTLRFGAKRGKVVDGFCLQAIVSASKDGFYDKDFINHGVLQITNLSSVKDGPDRTMPLLRPFKPYTLDFTMLAAATVKGRIVDAKGKAVAGMRLTVQCYSDPTEDTALELADATSDKDGRFAFANVPLVKVFFRLYLPEDRQDVSDPVELTEAGTYELEFVCDEETGELSMKVVSRPKASTGKKPLSEPRLKIVVTDKQGRPAGRIDFTLWRSVEASAVAADNDDDRWRVTHWLEPASGMVWQPIGGGQIDGDYTIDKVAIGSYRVTVSSTVQAPGHVGAKGYGTSERIYVDGAPKETTVAVRLETGTPLVVRVTDARSHKPVVASVMLVRGDGLPIGAGSWQWAVRTDDNGSVRYGSVPPGVYALRVKAQDWVSSDAEYVEFEREVSTNGAGPDGQVVDAPLAHVELSQVQIRERWPFVIEGTVADDQGRPVSGAEVTVCAGFATLYKVGSATTGEDGAYVLRFQGWMTRKADSVRREAVNQRASVAVVKDGFHETSRAPNEMIGLAASGKDAESGDGFFPGTTMLTPGSPYRLDFMMAPGAPDVAKPTAESTQAQ